MVFKMDMLWEKWSSHFPGNWFLPSFYDVWFRIRGFWVSRWSFVSSFWSVLKVHVVFDSVLYYFPFRFGRVFKDHIAIQYVFSPRRNCRNRLYVSVFPSLFVSHWHCSKIAFSWCNANQWFYHPQGTFCLFTWFCFRPSDSWGGETGRDEITEFKNIRTIWSVGFLVVMSFIENRKFAKYRNIRYAHREEARETVLFHP